VGGPTHHCEELPRVSRAVARGRCCSRICCSIAPPTRPRSCSPTHRREPTAVSPSRCAPAALAATCHFCAAQPCLRLCLRPPPYTVQYPQYPSAALRSHPRAAPIRLRSVALPGAMVPSRCRPQGGAACRAACRAVPCRCVGEIDVVLRWSYGRLRRRKARRPAAQRPRSTSGARSPSARGSRMLSSKVRPPSPAPSVVAGQSVKIGSFCGGASVRATGDGASRAHRLPHWMWTRSSVSKLALAAVGMLPQRLVRRWGGPIGAKARATLRG
jgi:hypothetical protein